MKSTSVKLRPITQSNFRYYFLKCADEENLCSLCGLDGWFSVPGNAVIQRNKITNSLMECIVCYGKSENKNFSSYIAEMNSNSISFFSF
jgi:hypothetical protein